jgi:hypothetical protein
MSTASSGIGLAKIATTGGLKQEHKFKKETIT